MPVMVRVPLEGAGSCANSAVRFRFPATVKVYAASVLTSAPFSVQRTKQ